MEECPILPALRKGKILAPARFGCLQGIPTLNITNGCLFRCTYCYARGYSQTPKKGEVCLYLNLPDLLKEEISKRKSLPPWVILNTSSDGFQPHPDILHVTYEVIQILLEHGIGISFLTKGIIPQRFLELLGRSPEKILAQIGLVSLSNRYWKEFEPATPSPERRMENIERLREVGITPEVRVDPIIPFVTDTKPDIKIFLGHLKERGIRRITLSYLHLRPAIRRQLMEELSPVHRRLIESCFKTQEWKTLGFSTKTKLLPKVIREKGYRRIKEMAEDIGVSAVVCQCKNPDLVGDLCGSGRVRAILGERTSAQLPLFQC